MLQGLQLVLTIGGKVDKAQPDLINEISLTLLSNLVIEDFKVQVRPLISRVGVITLTGSFYDSDASRSVRLAGGESVAPCNPDVESHYEFQLVSG